MRTREIRRAKAIIKLGNKCAKCGTNENLEIDHIDHESVNPKLFNPMTLYATRVPIETLEGAEFDEELDKCQLLCKECHIQKSVFDRRKESTMKHGNSMYTNKGCRCDICRKARHDYHIKYTLRQIDEELDLG